MAIFFCEGHPSWCEKLENHSIFEAHMLLQSHYEQHFLSCASKFPYSYSFFCRVAFTNLPLNMLTFTYVVLHMISFHSKPPVDPFRLVYTLQNTYRGEGDYTAPLISWLMAVLKFVGHPGERHGSAPHHHHHHHPIGLLLLVLCSAPFTWRPLASPSHTPLFFRTDRVSMPCTSGLCEYLCGFCSERFTVSGGRSS